MKKYLPGTVFVLACAVACALVLVSCGSQGTLTRIESPGAPVTVSALWMNPDNLATRDLYGGVGSERSAPRATSFEYVQGESLNSWGYDVKEADGRLWSVKLGPEVHAEVAVSRMLWAIGYHQPPVYVVDKWTLTGRHAGPQPAGRFRLETEGQKVVDVWSWYENPFVGTREFAGLIVANVLFNNWDLKTQNNKVYELTQPMRGQARVYVVRDVGASLGLTRRPTNPAWLWDKGSPQGTKGRIEDFESQDFILGVEGDHVVFDTKSGHTTLLESVTVEDVRWTCQLFNRLSREQMLDAFRAAHYERPIAERYVQKIRAKLAQGLALKTDTR